MGVVVVVVAVVGVSDASSLVSSASFVIVRVDYVSVVGGGMEEEGAFASTDRGGISNCGNCSVAYPLSTELDPFTTALDLRSVVA